MNPPPHEICTEFTVRSYETDSYAHLNNGVYISWFEHGRQLWLKSRDFSYDGLAARKQWFVVARTEVDFRVPLDEGQTIELSTVVEKLGRSSVRWRQVIRASTPDGEDSEQPKPPESVVVAEALTVMVFSGEGGGSIPIPADFRAAAESSIPQA